MKYNKSSLLKLFLMFFILSASISHGIAMSANNNQATISTIGKNAESAQLYLPLISIPEEVTSTVRVSGASVSAQSNERSGAPSVSGNGRFVAFYSEADNLVGGLSLIWYSGVFVRDRQTGATTLVSVASDGSEADPDAGIPSISTDGRFVAFVATSPNFVPDDTNDVSDVFIHDRETGETTRVSVASDGTQGDYLSKDPSVSDNGRFVAFTSGATNLVADDTNDVGDVFVHDQQTGETTRISVASNGMQGNSWSWNPAISGNGRFVAFASEADNLVAGDSNNMSDIFIHDRQTRETTRVSVAGNGSQALDNSYTPSISADGRFVAFDSEANNLVANDTSNWDVFRHDRQTGETIRISVAHDGTQANDSSSDPTISADGRFVAFASSASNLVVTDSNGISDVFLHDCLTGETKQTSIASDSTQSNSYASPPSISADGRFVAFVSRASNLVEDDSNNVHDVFLHDRQTGKTTRESGSDAVQGNAGASSPVISADGQLVAFYSKATNMVAGDINNSEDPFLHNRQTGETTLVSVASDGTHGHCCSQGLSISADGKLVAYASSAENLVADDTNGEYDIFLHDTQAGEATRVSIASDGTEGNDSSTSPAISADGRFVAFGSHASNLVADDTNNERDIFIHDRQTGETTRLSVASNGTQGNDYSGSPAISADGRFVTFFSVADNLVAGDTNSWGDIFLHDRQTGETIRISVASNGTQGNHESGGNAISANGRFIAFSSTASNLVTDDTNDARDVFLYDRQTGETTLLSVSSDGTQGNEDSGGPDISADGRFVTFYSGANNLVANDTNDVWDIFRHDRQSGETKRVSVSGDGTEGNDDSFNAHISGNGRFVAFTSTASNLIPGDTNGEGDIFIHDCDLENDK